MTKSKPKYVKCPRCELNYILKRNKFCDVCKEEMKAGATDDMSEELLDDAILCPVCKSNYLSDGEVMCVLCEEENLEVDHDDDDEVDWKTFVEKEEVDSDDLLPTDDDDEIDEELDSTFAEDLDDLDDDLEDIDDELESEDNLDELDEDFMDIDFLGDDELEEELEEDFEDDDE